MELKAHLPQWLKPGVYVHHKPTGTIFKACRCQKDRVTCQILILDAPKGIPSNEYFLLECELAQISHLTGGNPVVIEGKPFTLIRIPGGFKVTNGASTGVWMLSTTDPGYQAAQSLASFFSGSVATEEVDHAS